jgi:hypothetical protein
MGTPPASAVGFGLPKITDSRRFQSSALHVLEWDTQARFGPTKSIGSLRFLRARSSYSQGASTLRSVSATLRSVSAAVPVGGHSIMFVGPSFPVTIFPRVITEFGSVL